ncbi:MAG: hypothetical protein GXO39_09490 [Thermotogae bacterium]|nr:hypothetical protein [Thermotogota bacterium]
MTFLKTSEILEILGDFLTPPIYEGRGRWMKIMEVIRTLKQAGDSGILLLQSGGTKVFTFFEYGIITGSLLFEDESTLIPYEEEDFFNEKGDMRHIRPYRYSYSSLNGDVVMVVSAVYRASMTVDSMVPFPHEFIKDLMSLEFSGIVRSYSPLVFSIVLLEGMVVGTFSKGESFNLNDLLSAKDDLYTLKAFSVKEYLLDRTYHQVFKSLYERLRRLYGDMASSIPNFHLKVRTNMLHRSYANAYLDPIIGLVEPMEDRVVFHLTKRRGLELMDSFLEVLSDVIYEELTLTPPQLKRYRDEIESIRLELKEQI